VAGRRTALIVANDVYENAGLGTLRSPGADATALAEVLSDRRISDFDVQVVHNETTHVVLRHIEDLFADSRPDDVLLLHFSCHGLKGESGELHFAMRDTRPDRLRSTAVSADYVQRCMAASRSRSIVLLLDCCYGGAYRQGVAVRASGDAHVLDSFSGGRGRAVITASSSMEYAFEGDRLADDLTPRPSVFTAAVVEGLATGAADRDEDGLIGLGELYDYVFERVRDRNPNQTPSRDVEMQGELFLARSGRKRIRPRPMPPDLLAATTDSNMFTRLGAIGELRTRLANRDLQVAVGAHETLTRMAGNDISTVVDAASTALADAAITPTVRWGPDGTGTIRLSGPPLARACTFTSPQPWIRLTEVDDGVDITVAGTSHETRHGTVVVQGPTGRVDVPVVVPATAPPKADAPPTPAAEPAQDRLAAAEATGAEAAARTTPDPAAGRTDPPPAQAKTTADSASDQPTAPPADKPKPAAVEPAQPTPATPATNPAAAEPPVPLAQPATVPTPPERIAPPARPRATAVAGGLAVLSGLVLFVGLLLASSYGDRLDEDLPFALWYLIPIACLTLITGAVLLFTRGGAGFFAGMAATSPWGVAVLVAASVEGHVNDSYPGVWTLSAGLTLLLVAGCVAAWSAHRSGAAPTAWRRPDRWSGATLAIALVGAFWLYGWSFDQPSGLGFALGVVPPILVVVVAIWAMFLHPRQFAFAMAVGWLTGGLFVGLALTEAAIEQEGGTWIGSLGFFTALLAVVASTGVSRNPSDQPLTR
jgi:caspase domain-containing protein